MYSGTGRLCGTQGSAPSHRLRALFFLAILILRLMDLRGTIVTADAMNGQKGTVPLIVGGNRGVINLPI